MKKLKNLLALAIVALATFVFVPTTQAIYTFKVTVTAYDYWPVNVQAWQIVPGVNCQYPPDHAYTWTRTVFNPTDTRHVCYGDSIRIWVHPPVPYSYWPMGVVKCEKQVMQNQQVIWCPVLTRNLEMFPGEFYREWTVTYTFGTPNVCDETLDVYTTAVPPPEP